MNPTLLNALTSQSHLRFFTALRIELNSGQIINLIDGSGVVVFPVDGAATTFSGKDDTFGTIAAEQSISERIAEESPTFAFSLLPAGELAIGTLMDPLQQESRVRVWLGLVNDDTGAVIGEPELMWDGRLDTAQTNYSSSMMIAEIETVSAFDRLFVAEEAARLNGVWLRSIFPTDDGLDYVYDATTEVYWGIEAPAKAAVSSYTGGTISVREAVLRKNGLLK